jgi:hypothetical protein
MKSKRFAKRYIKVQRGAKTAKEQVKPARSSSSEEHR